MPISNRAINLKREPMGDALVSMTIVAAREVIYSIVRCPVCDRRIMDVPGTPPIICRVVSGHKANGFGRVIKCQRKNCKTFVEVIERR